MKPTPEQIAKAREWLRGQNLTASQLLSGAPELVATYAAHCTAEKDAQLALTANLFYSVRQKLHEIQCEIDAASVGEPIDAAALQEKKP